MKGPRHAEAGISLLEVAAALVDILVLLLVIVCVLAKMARREEGGPPPCRKMLEQIGKACVAYSECYGGFWPAASALDGSIHPDPSRSLLLLYPVYLSRLKVFRCPRTEDVPAAYAVSRNGRSWLEFGPCEKRESTSYGYDQYTVRRHLVPRSVMAADMDGSSVSDPESETANHEGGQNVLFFDGHLAWKSTNYASATPFDNIYVREPDWGPDADTCIKRTAGD